MISDKFILDTRRRKVKISVNLTGQEPVLVSQLIAPPSRVVPSTPEMTTESTPNSQWLFPISALSCTPTAQDMSLHEEMYDRSRGIEFLYRLGTSIGLFVWAAFHPVLSILNPCLSSAIPRAYSLLRRGFIASLCGILCLIIIAKSVSLVASSSVTNTSSDHRGCLCIPCYKDRRVRKEAQGRS